MISSGATTRSIHLSPTPPKEGKPSRLLELWSPRRQKSVGCGHSGVLPQQGSNVVDRSLHILFSCVVVGLDGDEHIGRSLPGTALSALPPAPPSRAHDSVVVDKDHFARLRVLHLFRIEFSEGFVALREAHGDSPDDTPEVEHRDVYRPRVLGHKVVGYATSLVRAASQVCRASLGLTKPFFSTRHSALYVSTNAPTAWRTSSTLRKILP